MDPLQLQGVGSVMVVVLHMDKERVWRSSVWQGLASGEDVLGGWVSLLC